MATATAAKGSVPGDNINRALLSEADLAREFSALVKEAESIEAEARKLPLVLEDDEDLDRVKEIVPRLRTMAKRIDDQRDETKRPYLNASNLVQSWFKALEGNVSIVKLNLENAGTRYLNKKAEREREQKRQEEERHRIEAKRLADEAIAAAKTGNLQGAVEKQAEASTASARADNASAAAAAKPSQLARTTTQAGTATLVDVWQFKIEDAAKIDLNLLRGHFAQRDIEDAIARFVKGGGRELAGVKIFSAPKGRF